MLKKTMLVMILTLVITAFFGSTVSFAQEYYVSNAGNDKNQGVSPEKPWESVARVNGFAFQPGDVINFKCGDSWREQLIPESGDSKGNITYRSYGFGNKPLLLGSISKSLKTDWKYDGSHIWSIDSAENRVISQEIIPVDQVTFWAKEKKAVSKSVKDSAAGKYIQLQCQIPCSSIYDMQLMLNGLNIRNGKSYIFSFRARSTAEFVIPAVKLIKSTSPWTDYSGRHTEWSFRITSEWKTYSILYQANNNDDDAELNIFLGKNFPRGVSVCFDSFIFSEVENSDIYSDVGNIIFDGGKSCGTKVFSDADLKHQNDFIYDWKNKTIKVYSIENPAEKFGSIELALNKHIIDINDKSYISIKNMDLRYSSACGINCINTHHIRIVNCNISFIGGSVLKWKNGQPVRYGNGVNFLMNTHDNLVFGCRLGEIYDAAVTNQGYGNGIKQYNIAYENNVIWNAEWSFEYWNSSKDGMTSNISFDNNTCRNAGSGWGHKQRPNPSGMHICFPDNIAKTSGIFIRNNLFEHSTTSQIYVSDIWNGLNSLIMENNRYIQNNRDIVVVWGISKVYYCDDFRKFTNQTGKDITSDWIYRAE